ncbi:hypothetical protein CR513_24475, partial [Mucuna pruriens]
MNAGKQKPTKFWGEAVSTAAYILNRSPIKRLEGITPEEVWIGAKPNVTHLRIFGSICSRNIFGQPTHILKLYELESDQVSTNRDVICDENGSWTWNASSSKAKLRVLKEELIVAPTFNQDPGVIRSLYLKDQELFHDSVVTSKGELVHSTLIVEVESVKFDKAVAEKKWLKAMKEINSIMKNQTWELVDCPSNKKLIALKWVYKVKVNPKGEVVKHQVRLVAKGIDYGEFYALVARIKTIRLVVAIATNVDWSMHQLDLHSLMVHWKKFMCFNHMDLWLRVGFKKCTLEYEVYVKSWKNSVKLEKLIVCLYVDDLSITSISEATIVDFKRQMMNEFEMSDLGFLSYFLGIEFKITKYGTIMHQSKYAKDLLRKLNMQQSNPTGTPVEVGHILEKETNEELVDLTHYRKIVGCLRYLCNTRPNLSFSVGLIHRFMQEPRQSHLLTIKRILRYVQGTIDFGVLFPKGEDEAEPELIEYFDLDWCGDKSDKKKSTTGYIFFYGGALISWSSTKEHVVALSSCEGEYIAASKTACQAVWLEVQLLVDNKSTIDLARHPTTHGRSKHIETRFHFPREQVSNEKPRIEHCITEIQFADILTKALKLERFRCLRNSIGVVCVNATLN